MASLSQSQLQLLARAAKQLLPRVTLTAGWKKLHQLWLIGEPDGANKYLYLTHNDYALLRKMAQIDSGLDILALDFDVPRQQMAQLSANEKYANISPDADYVLLKLAPNIIQSLLSNCAADSVVDVLTALDSSLRLKADAAVALCKRLKIAQLIVVENLDSFDNVFAHTFSPNLQSMIDNCVVLYRGSHDYSPAGRKHFLHLLAELELDVIAFTDLDPAGLMIANTLEHCHSMIVPQRVLEAPDKLLAISQINSVSDFNKQHKQSTYLNNIVSQHAAVPVAFTPQWISLTQWLIDHSVSIKQQHMLAKSLPLSLLKIHS